MNSRGTVARSLKKRQGGFTLMELLMASTIMVVALLGIASVLPTADMTLHRSGQITKAISLAQEMLEMIRNDPFTNLDLYNGVDTRNTATYPVNDPLDVSTMVSGDPANFLGGFNITKWKNDINTYLLTGAGISNGFGTIAVTTVASDAGGSPVLRKVTTTVGWTESSKPYSVTIATLASGI